MNTDPGGAPELSSAVLLAPCSYKCPAPAESLPFWGFHLPPVLRGTSQTNVQVNVRGPAISLPGFDCWLYLPLLRNFLASYLSYILSFCKHS